MAIELFRYIVEPDIYGSGGMGEVYKAKDILSGDQVVIKTINTRRLDLDIKSLNTFIKEAQASFRLGDLSDHIVKVTDLGFENNIPYMAQEYITGGNLLNKVGTATETEARSILSQLISAISTAHHNKIVHSDISPDNVLFDSTTDTWKLNDFGILKIIETHLISRGTQLHRGGKALYMPPLHNYHREMINESTDIYALGMIYYVLLTGQFLIPDSMNAPQVPNPVIVKATDSPLEQEQRIFIQKCIRNEFESIDQVSNYFKG